RPSVRSSGSTISMSSSRSKCSASVSFGAGARKAPDVAASNFSRVGACAIGAFTSEITEINWLSGCGRGIAPVSFQPFGGTLGSALAKSGPPDILGGGRACSRAAELRTQLPLHQPAPNTPGFELRFGRWRGRGAQHETRRRGLLLQIRGKPDRGI